jgi:hypothetical protein
VIALVIEKCDINNFSQNGVDFEPALANPGTSSLTIVDTVINGNGSNGGPLGNYGNILVEPAGTGVNAVVSLDRVQVLNGFKPGIRVDGSSTTGTINVSVRNSSVENSGGTGIAAQTEAPDNAVINLTIDGSTISNNVGFGVHSTGANATVYISNDTITENVVGVGVTTSNLISVKNNAIIGNGTNGAPTSTQALQ